MKLYLVQHGEALSKDEDPERPLSPVGERDVARLAAFIGERDLRAQRVIHSGKTRAQQTAQRLAAAMHAEGGMEASDMLGPKDPVKPIARYAEAWREDSMVVGHLPFLGSLAGYLVNDEAERSPVDFVPGSLACFERGEGGAWRIAWMLRPELLAPASPE